MGNCRLAAPTDVYKGILAASNWNRLDSFWNHSCKSLFRACMSHDQDHVSMNAVR